MEHELVRLRHDPDRGGMRGVLAQLRPEATGMGDTPRKTAANFLGHSSERQIHGEVEEGGESSALVCFGFDPRTMQPLLLRCRADSSPCHGLAGRWQPDGE